MRTTDVTATQEKALAFAGLEHTAQRPKLLSDNGPSYISRDLASWLKKRTITHIRGAPFHL